MENGFKKLNAFLEENSLFKIESILKKYHEQWLIREESFYKKGAINSAYITNGDFLNSAERLEILKFIGSTKLVNEARKVLGSDTCFLNTQIFFNPFKHSQKNYWHRDIQYTGLNENEQRLMIESQVTEVIHLRLALAEEFGLEFIPQSHFRWDTQEELEIRMQSPSDDINGSCSESLQRGDLLIFDANILHRGLYGKERFAFDILFCKSKSHAVQFMNKEVMPHPNELGQIECPEVFLSL